MTLQLRRAFRPLAWAYGFGALAALLLAGCQTITPEQKACLDKWGASYREAVSKHEICLIERGRLATQWAACIDLESAKPKAQRQFDLCGPRPPGDAFCGQFPGHDPRWQGDPCGLGI